MKLREFVALALVLFAILSAVLLAASLALVHPLAGVAAGAACAATLFLLAVIGVVREPRFGEAPVTLAVLLIGFLRKRIVAARDGSIAEFSTFCLVLFVAGVFSIVAGPGSVTQYNLMCIGDVGTVFGWLVNPSPCTASGTSLYAYAFASKLFTRDAELPLHVVGSSQGHELFCHPRTGDDETGYVCEPKPSCVAFAQGSKVGTISRTKMASSCATKMSAICLSLAQGGKEALSYEFPFSSHGVTICPTSYVPKARRAEVQNAIYVDLDPKQEVSFAVWCSPEVGKWDGLEPHVFTTHFAPDEVQFDKCP